MALRSSNHTNLYLRATVVSLRSQLAYPVEFLAPALTYALFVFVFSRLYSTALAPGQSIAGYDRASLVYYFMIAELAVFGYGRMFFTLSDEIKSGRVAYTLVRPFDFIRYHAAVLLGPTTVQILWLTVVGMLIVVPVAGLPVGVGLLQSVLVLLSLLLSGVLCFLLQMSLSMTAFWFEENSAFFWIFQKLTLVVGTLMPVEFLPATLQRIAAWTPFPSMGYAPARIAVAFDPREAAVLLLTQAAWTVAAAVLARLLFHLGCRRVAVNGG